MSSKVSPKSILPPLVASAQALTHLVGGAIKVYFPAAGCSLFIFHIACIRRLDCSCCESY